MRYSGADMQPENKETSRGELADNVLEC